MTGRHSSEAGSDEQKLWHGIYIGTVAQTRDQDFWVRVQVPQVMGDTISNWARPMIVTAIGQRSNGAPFISDVSREPNPNAGSNMGAFRPYPPVGAGRAVGWGDRTMGETGPGPDAGTIVLVMFLGGDRNHPVYALTSQVDERVAL